MICGGGAHSPELQGSKIRRELWLRPCYRDILHCQPFDTLGNHPRHFRLAVCDLLRTISVITAVSWDQQFFDPISLPGRKPLVTLREAAQYITKLPKAEHDAGEWQAAMQALMLVAEHHGPTMFARIGVMRALNRRVQRVFDPNRKDPHWGRRKPRRDQ
jgi:hypothetical protein